MTETTTPQIISIGPENTINEVVVFTSHAQIKRQITTPVQLGTNRFLIELHAFEVDADSLQAAVYGTGEIISVQYKEISVTEAETKQLDLNELKAQQHQLEDQRRTLKYTLEDCKKQRAFVDSALKQVETRDVLGKINIKELFENLQYMLEIVDTTYAKLSQQELDIFKKTQAIEEQLNLVQQQLATRPDVPSTHKIVEVLFNSKTSEKIKMEISYIVNYAIWKPFYKVDVTQDLTNLTIMMFAHIEQNTGEDWQQVKLSVSNAMPIQSTRLPELKSWHIQQPDIFECSTDPWDSNTQQAPLNGVQLDGSSNMEELTTSNLSDFPGSEVHTDDFASEADPLEEADLYIAYGRYEHAETVLLEYIKNHPNSNDAKNKLRALYLVTRNTQKLRELARNHPGKTYLQEILQHIENDDTAFPSSAPAATFIQAQDLQSSLAFEFQLPTLIDIPANGNETLLPLFTKIPKYGFFYYTIPKQDPLVYLVCQADLSNEWLPGRMNIHIGGRFVGNTILDEKQAGQELLINLGSVQDVKIKREKYLDEVSKRMFKGMLDRSNALRKVEIRIVIENLKEQEIQIKILDAIPVSSTDTIQIKDVTMTPEPTLKDWQSQQGVMQWDLNIAAKSVIEIRMQFIVKYPRNCQIAHLNID
ncbi:hypothetical protein TI05_02375 [Achromatium sp. WMS3]|nr:hypothetical protein TI05_02375 [Achromatium sp. WMS3]